MKIGIYGDSYAANIFKRSVNDDVSYIEMLYHNYDIVNFGQGGSSLFYSYDKFLKTENQFDKIIFLVTGVGRICLDPFQHPTINPAHLHVAGVDHANHYLENYKNNFEYYKNAKVFQAVKDYILYVRNSNQDQTFHNLMLDNIKRIRPDAFIIETNKFGGGNDTDLSFWKQDDTDLFVNYQDLRHCHLSKEKHIILYEMIDENIKTGKDIDYSRLRNVKPSKTFEDYFKSAKDEIVHMIPFEEYKENFK